MAWYLEEKNLGYTPWLGGDPEEEPESDDDGQEPEDVSQDDAEDAFNDAFIEDEAA